MSGRVFIDTNVFVYLFDASSPTKRERSRRVIEQEGRAGTVVLSTQVLSEFYVAVTRKLGKPLSELDAVAAARSLCAFHVVSVDGDAVMASIALSRKHRLSLWDSLVITAASGAGCARLLTEDLQHGSMLAGVRIENPYVAT